MPTFTLNTSQAAPSASMNRWLRALPRGFGRRRSPRDRGRKHRLRLQRRSVAGKNHACRPGRGADFHGPSEGRQPPLRIGAHTDFYPWRLLRPTAELADKLEMVVRADLAARANDPAIKQVRAAYGDQIRHVLIAGSDGALFRTSSRWCGLMFSPRPGRQQAPSPVPAAAVAAWELEFFSGGAVAGIFRQGSGEAGDRPARCPRRRRRAKWKWSWGPAGRESCCTKPSDMAWRRISIARAFPLSAAGWASGWQPNLHGGGRRDHSCAARLTECG